MKRHPTFTTNDALTQLRSADPETIANVGGTTTLSDRMRAADALRSFAVYTRCVGCDDRSALSDCSVCICGGFVCRACEALETDGVCDHEFGGIDPEAFTSG